MERKTRTPAKPPESLSREKIESADEAKLAAWCEERGLERGAAAEMAKALNAVYNPPPPFPVRVVCPRCGSLASTVLHTRESVQERRCEMPVCRCRFASDRTGRTATIAI